MNFLNKKIPIVLTILLIFCIFIYFFTKDEDYEPLETQNFYIEKNSTITKEEQTEIIVHITGEVITPGIVNLSKGLRIYDAIQAAGGATDISDLSKVNLAYELKDGQKIYIPSVYDKDDISYIEDSAGNNVLISDKANSNLININTANQAELETLPGIRRINSTKNNPV